VPASCHSRGLLFQYKAGFGNSNIARVAHKKMISNQGRATLNENSFSCKGHTPLASKKNSFDSLLTGYLVGANFLAHLVLKN
jgi:hypothetical protein